MSNQRAGKTHRASANDGMSEMKLRNFFRTAASLMEDESDAKFYFEQVVEHFNKGGGISSDDPTVIRRILGL
jgi:hypothetical protein